MADRRASRLIMVTSARPGEGKTFTALNLALAFASERSVKALLVDVDTQHSRCRRSSGFEGKKGIVDVLAGNLELPEVLIQTNIPNLMILPAGRGGPHVPELLSSPEMGALLDEMTQRLPDHYLVIDTPPCMASSDAAALAPLVGQIVFVVEANNTQQGEIEAALGTLSTCPRISLLLNKSDSLATEHFGSYGYNYHSDSRSDELRVRPKSHKGLAAGAFWPWHFALCPLLVFGTTAAIPAAAQTSEGGGAPSSSGASGASPEAGPAVTGGGAVTAPALPGPVPETLPPPSISGLGVPNPAAPPYSVNNQIPTLTSPPTLRLQPYAGVVPLQAYDPNAPAVLIQPSVSLGEIFTDNVNYVHSPRNFAAITQLGGGVSVSVDTPRLQAVATGQGSEYLYLPSSSSTPNQPSGSLYANGHATIYPDLFYVDAQSSITQSSTLAGLWLSEPVDIAEKSANSAVHHQYLAVSDKVVWRCSRHRAAVHFQFVELRRQYRRYEFAGSRAEQSHLHDAERRNFHRGYGPGLSEDGSAVHSGRRRNQWLIREPSHSGQRV